MGRSLKLFSQFQPVVAKLFREAVRATYLDYDRMLVDAVAASAKGRRPNMSAEDEEQKVTEALLDESLLLGHETYFERARSLTLKRERLIKESGIGTTGLSLLAILEKRNGVLLMAEKKQQVYMCVNEPLCRVTMTHLTNMIWHHGRISSIGYFCGGGGTIH